MNMSFMKNPNVLLGFGLGMMFVSVVNSTMAADATRDRLKKLEEEKGELTNLDKFKVRAISYLPTTISFVVGTCAIGKSQGMIKSENAKLAASCGFLENALLTYTDKVKEVVGENKNKKVLDKIAEDKASKITAEDLAGAVRTGKGDQLFMDFLTGQLFYSSRNAVDAAANDIGAMQLSEVFVKVSELHDRWGIRSNEAGDIFGFEIDEVEGAFSKDDLWFTSVFLEDLGVTCAVIHYDFQCDKTRVKCVTC